MQKNKHIIVWESKHGNIYYSAETEFEQFFAYSEIFRQMLKDGFYNDMSDLKKIEGKINAWKENLSNLDISGKTDQEIEESKKKLKILIRENEYNVRLFRSARDGNVKSMKEWIRNRSDKEYERVYQDIVICPEDN